MANTAYQSSHTGAQIDAAVDAATQIYDNFYALYGGKDLGASSSNQIDLNNVTDTGSWYCQTNDASQYVAHKPTSTNHAFRLWVSAPTGTSNPYRAQRYQLFDSKSVYERLTIDGGSSWGDWVMVQADLSDYASAGDVSTLQGYFTNGVANSATKLQASRSIWGQSFDGSADISGDLTGVGDITASGEVSATTFVGDLTGNASTATVADKSYQVSDYQSGNGAFFAACQRGIGSANTGALVYAYGSNPIRLYTNGTEKMRIAADGKVGIGTNAPSKLLHVNGDAAITGTLTLGGVAVVSVYSGSSAPSSSTGSDGDIYIQTS